MKTRLLGVCLAVAIIAALVIGSSGVGAQTEDPPPPDDSVNPNVTEAGAIPVAEPLPELE